MLKEPIRKKLLLMIPFLFKKRKYRWIYNANSRSRGSPDELRIMAEYIGKLGYSTYNCRLPGHGSKINYFTKFSFIDWYESLKYGYFSLKNISKKIIIIGKGIGAYLGILISMFNKVDRLILLLPQPYKGESKRNNLHN